MAHACDPCYMGGIGRRISLEGQPLVKKLETLFGK
jgi:hypothetical protein